MSDLEQGDTTNERAVAAAVVALRLTRKQSQLLLCSQLVMNQRFISKRIPDKGGVCYLASYLSLLKIFLIPSPEVIRQFRVETSTRES